MHYNIQIMVQQVGTEEVPATRRGSTTTNASTRKTVVEVLNLKVVAADEREAYAKAAKMLEAATPKFPTGPISGSDMDDEEDEEDF
jgi:hypothetical protein